MSEFVIERSDSLQHFGIKGQKWGVRRYENEDGTLTDAGKIRYAKSIRDAKNYKTAKERFKTIGRATKRGAEIATGVMTGSAAASVFAERISMLTRHHGYVHASGLSTLDVAKAITKVVAAGAIGGAAVSSIHQGYQAVKVKRGQNFIEKYKLAYEKTYNGGNQNV